MNNSPNNMKSSSFESARAVLYDTSLIVCIPPFCFDYCVNSSLHRPNELLHEHMCNLIPCMLNSPYKLLSCLLRYFPALNVWIEPYYLLLELRPAVLDRVEIRAIWRPWKELYPSLLKPILNHLCGVYGCVILHEGETGLVDCRDSLFEHVDIRIGGVSVASTRIISLKSDNVGSTPIIKRCPHYLANVLALSIRLYHIVVPFFM